MLTHVLDKKGSDDEELRAIGQEHQQRTVEKVLNLALNNNDDPENIQSPTGSNKDRFVQHHGSLDMLTRVFPFHPKNAVESALETCGGDVAKAVQQLVGHQPNHQSSPMGMVMTSNTENGTMVFSSKANTGGSSYSMATSGSNKSAFLPTSSLLSAAAISSPSRSPYAHHTSGSVSSSTSMAYPSALRMMSPYSSAAGMMSFLHPSAYFAAAASAAAAAASSPHSYPWLFPSHYRPPMQHQHHQFQHICLPGCSICPISTSSGTSSTSSSSSHGDGVACNPNSTSVKVSTLMLSSSPDKLFKSHGGRNKDLLFQHNNGGNAFP